MRLVARAAIGALFLASASPASAQGGQRHLLGAGRLVQPDRQRVRRSTGIKVDMTLKGSGEALAQLKRREGRTRRPTSGSAAPATRTCRRPKRA